MLSLTLLFGAIVGISLGLTGGGGAIFAVPLLVFGLSVAPVQAVAISLIAVGATAFAGFLHRLRRGTVDLLAGGVFAAGGILGAPIGTLIGGRTPEALLLVLFAGLLLIVALRMWITSTKKSPAANEEAPPRLRDATGKFSIPCAATLVGAGLLTGVLSGIFGVGGGFVVVPALLLTTHMGIHRATATSFMVITLISAAAIASFMLGGQAIAWEIALPFMLGGMVGMGFGTQLSGRLSGPRLQQAFAITMVTVALITLFETTTL